MGGRKVNTFAGLWRSLRTSDTPAESVFQVLISIQSMILCDEPYLNEPGWASGAGTPQSIACELT